MKRRGFFVMEAVIGMFLLMVIAGSLAVTLHLREQVHQKADARSRAINRAETALISLQNHRAADLPATAVEPLDTRAPAGLRWVRVTSSQNGETAELIGLVPPEAHP